MRKSLSRRSVLAGLVAVAASPAVLAFPSRSLFAQDFGVVGDGRTDATPVLQRMLKAAEARGKGTIKLPAGRFRLEKALVLPANVRLEGEGIDRTTLFMADGKAGHVVSIPYGWAQVADLTIDGNETGRRGKIGHNIRLRGDNVLIERVRVLNAASYGIAVAQKYYSRKVTIRDVVIENAGADGIDIKNDLGRTEDTLIQNVTVKGFGRPPRSLTPERVGGDDDKRGDKAAVDLRGTCEVSGLTILGIGPDRDGLRFRDGEVGSPHGPGPHGSTASNVVIRGTRGQKASIGISVVARNVRLNDIDVEGGAIGVFVGTDDLRINRGKFGGFDQAALYVRPTRFSNPDSIEVQAVQFAAKADIVLKKGVKSARFKNCEFHNCRKEVEAMLRASQEVALSDCRFAPTCT